MVYVSNREDYISRIAGVIKNYRKHELAYALNEEHVQHWVSQFERKEQEIVLQETYNLLEKCYFKKKQVKEFLLEVIQSSELWGDGDIGEEIQHTQFLKIQNKGSSQAKLLKLLKPIVEERYGFALSCNENKNTTRYIYLDDCLFSGNTLRRDIERWIPDAKDGTLLDIIFLSAYSSGEYYIAKKVLNNICTAKGINYRIWSLKRFNNFPNDRYKYDCLWPKQIEDENVTSFIRVLEEYAEKNTWPIRTFRETEYDSELFTDNRSREIFEQAMLKAGSYIYFCCQNPNASMKPLGYDFFNSLGFGAFFATFNNISNNSPLAFWWGDPFADIGHPFRKWYPLLPRRGNTPRGEINAW